MAAADESTIVIAIKQEPRSTMFQASDY